MKKSVTWGDKIRTMTDEELAEWRCERSDCPPGHFPKKCDDFAYVDGCKDCWLDWFRQEANNGTSDTPC